MKTFNRYIRVKMFCALLSAILVFVPQVDMSTQALNSAKATDFITSKVDIDELLRRPYDENVVTGYSDGLFALHSNGWGFDNNSVFRTGLSTGYGMQTDVLIDGAATIPTSGEFMPSHITRTYRADELSFMKNNLAIGATVTASFTSKYDTLSQVNDGIISYNDAPRSRWSNYSSPIRTDEDYLEFTFVSNRLVNGMNIYLFTDNSACALPEKITVKYKSNGEWADCNISNTSAPIVSGKNTILFSTVNTNAVRIHFKAKAQKCVAVTELEISEGGSSRSNLAISATTKASYTSSYDSLAHINDGVISYNDSPRNRWSNYISGGRNTNDYIDFDLGINSSVNQVSVYVYNDNGACVPPKNIAIYYYNGNGWTKIGDISSVVTGKNTLDFNKVNTKKIRVEFTAQSGKSVSATEIEIMGVNSATDVSRGIVITEDKFVASDDVLVSIIKAKNNGDQDTYITVNAKSSRNLNSFENNGKFISISGKDFDDFSTTISKTETLKPGESKEFILAMAFSDTPKQNKAKFEHIFGAENILREHTEEFLGWFEENVPYFNCSDKTLLQTYYFRWYTYRNHIRLTQSGNYVISEFLPNVSWAGTDNTISCAANHHFYEGRWIKNQGYLNDYQDFWVSDNAQPRLYSFPMADSYYSRYLVSGMKNQVTRYTNDLIENYNGWVSSKYNSSKGLFHQLCDRDGMEYSLGGDGYRPTINSYMFADATAISKISSLIGNTSNSNLFRSKATAIKNAVQQTLWNGSEQFFETVSTSTNSSVNIREQMGYVPWCYNLPDDSTKYSVAFSQLLDSQGFSAPFGPTSAERRDPDFMKQEDHNCLWNGPSWPFATSQTLTAAANLLNNYSNNSSFSKDNYFNLLKTYANSHYKDGYSWLAEDLDPITGEWIVDFPRSVNYNHSTFNDLIITGLAGLRPDESDTTLTINPLITDSSLSYFVLENVLYKGRNVTIVYDKNGDRYNSKKGLSVYVDGKLSASSDTIKKLEVAFNGHTFEDGVCTKCGEAHPSLSTGDVNGDSKTDLVDLLCLKRRMANSTTNILCDTNGDSKVNTDDLVHMKKILLGDL